MSRDALLIEVISAALRETVEEDPHPDPREVQRIARAVRAGLGDPDAAEGSAGSTSADEDAEER